MEMPRDRRSRKRAPNFVDTLLPSKKVKATPSASTNFVEINNSLPYVTVADVKLESSSASPDDAPLAHYIDMDPSLLLVDEEDEEAEDDGDESSPPIDDEGASEHQPINGEGDDNGGAVVNGNNNSTYFTCAHCNKFFWSEASLKHHSSLYHSEKSFVCEICGKAFRFRSNLAEHRSVHTSLKPYVCKYCGKSSRLKGNLTKHILKHHKKEQNAFIGKDDIIIRKGKKSVKDPAAVDFLEKSMIVLTPDSVNSASIQLFNMAKHSEKAAGNEPPPSKRSRSSKSAASSNAAASNVGGLSSVSAALASVNEIMDIAAANNYSSSVDGEQFVGRRSSSKSAGGVDDNSNCLPVENSFLRRIAASDTPDSLHSSTNFQLQSFADSLLSTATSMESPNSRLKAATNSSAERFGSRASGGVAANVGGSQSAAPNTRCAQCGKHFRKAANLALHVATKHAVAVSNGYQSGNGNNVVASSTPVSAAVAPPSLPLASDLILPSSLLKGLELFPSSPPPLKLGNRQALVNGAAASLGSLLMGADPTAVLACGLGSLQQTSTSTVQKDLHNATQSSNANHNNVSSSSIVGASSNITKDLREIKAVLNELKLAGIPEASKVETLLLAVDARVNRLEKQVELSLATLYSLVQMQSEMNSAFLQFKCDVLEQLKSLHNTVKTKDEPKHK